MYARQIEEAALNSWPALQQILFDGWVIRFADGYTKRANSVTPVYSSFLPVSEKIPFCERLYQEKRLPMIFRLPSCFPHVQELDAFLVQKGYNFLEHTLVLSTLLTPGKNLPVAGFQIVSLDEWLPLHSQFSQAHSERQALHHAILQKITPRTLFALYCEDGVPVACGLGVLENTTFGLFDIVTSVDRRKKGHGTRLITGMLAWAEQNGGRQAYLQVLQTNLAACHLYTRLGFQELYHYWYRVQALRKES